MYKKTVVALTIVCTFLILALMGVAIGWSVTNRQIKADAENKEQSLENVYKRNYYELTYELSNAGDVLNKLLVSYSPSQQQKLLTSLSEHTASAVTCLSTLADTSSTGEKTVSFINKVGDYAKSLNYKISLGKALDNDDKDNLSAVYNALLSLNKSLAEMSDKIEDNYNFLQALNGENDLMISFLNNVEMDIKYPSLIYDGPFSDALEKNKPSLEGDEIDEARAKEIAKTYLPFEGEPEYVTENKGDIETFVFKVMKDKAEYYVTLSKKGGWLVSLTSNIQANDNNHTDAEALKVAKDFLLHLGITSMEEVWVSDYNSIYFINFVYKSNDVLYYPDMIKVKVSAEDNSVVGVECLNYLYNHKERTSEQSPSVSKDSAQSKIKDLEIETIRLAVIPTGSGKETLTWEIAGKSNEDYYFFYISAESGEEVDILRVVDSAQGKLLV